MAARLMNGKSGIVQDFLKKQGKSQNEIDHLLENQSNLRIVNVTVSTLDKEKEDRELYTLPYELVYIIREKKNDKKDKR
jgi:3-oxoacyl-[acyl-carrier-protein] synthase III